MEGYDRQATAAALTGALPYMRLFRGRTFVIKVSGSILEAVGALDGLVRQVSVLTAVGIRVVLVHGGGPQTTALSKRLGLEARLVDGRRVTDDATLAAAIMSLNGTVATAFLAACRREGLPALAVSGVAADLLLATRRPPQVAANGEPVDFGNVGDLQAVNPGVLSCLLDAGLVPVVSPLAADRAGNVLNVNADTVASALASALQAEKLVLLTPSGGLLKNPDDPQSLLDVVDLADLDALEAGGVVRNGMRPKVKAAREALAKGVRRVHLVGYAARGNLLIEVFTNEGAGTLIVRDRSEAVEPGLQP
jgi:acetylglutamate kinase